MKNLPVFHKGAQFYCDLTKTFLEELGEEIERAQKMIDGMHLAKEGQLRKFLEIFDQNKIEVVHLDLKDNIETACKTLRKLPRFGFIEGYDPKFEWPTIEDLMKMTKDKPIKLVSFKYKKSSNYIFGIQVILSNGVNSPLFESANTYALEEIAINSGVKKIRGSVNITAIGRVHFIDKDGKEIAMIKAYDDAFAPD